MRRAQHVGAFRHEVHAAEDDELGFGMLRDFAGELERVAGVIGELDHFVALIVMTKNDDAPPKRRAGRRNAAVHFLVRQPQVPLGQRLPLGQVFLLVRRQNRQQHKVSAETLIISTTVETRVEPGYACARPCTKCQMREIIASTSRA